MARSKAATSRKKNSRWLFLIPVAGLTIIVVAFAFSVGLFPGPPAAVDFTSKITIRLSNANNTVGNDVVPSAIGVPGGIWQSHVLDALGLDSHYPVYADAATQAYPGYALIHVRSRVVHQFTLGDFFDVWGQPLGQNLTLNRPAEVNGGPKGYLWFMCVASSPSSPFTKGLWGNEVLTSGKIIILVYGNAGCSLG
jgi:hypothetical protein